MTSRARVRISPVKRLLVEREAVRRSDDGSFHGDSTIKRNTDEKRQSKHVFLNRLENEKLASEQNEINCFHELL